MFLKPLSAVLTVLFLVSPLYAEDAKPADESATGEQPASPIEQRIRAYRESFDRRQMQVSGRDEALTRRQQEIRARMEARRMLPPVAPSHPAKAGSP